MQSGPHAVQNFRKPFIMSRSKFDRASQVASRHIVLANLYEIPALP